MFSVEDAQTLTIEVWLPSQVSDLLYKAGFGGDRCDVFIDDDISKPQLYRIYLKSIADTRLFLDWLETNAPKQ
jgi:hypothetical protein